MADINKGFIGMDQVASRVEIGTKVDKRPAWMLTKEERKKQHIIPVLHESYDLNRETHMKANKNGVAGRAAYVESLREHKGEPPMENKDQERVLTILEQLQVLLNEGWNVAESAAKLGAKASTINQYFYTLKRRGLIDGTPAQPVIIDEQAKQRIAERKKKMEDAPVEKAEKPVEAITLSGAVEETLAKMNAVIQDKTDKTVKDDASKVVNEDRTIEKAKKVIDNNAFSKEVEEAILKMNAVVVNPPETPTPKYVADLKGKLEAKIIPPAPEEQSEELIFRTSDIVRFPQITEEQVAAATEKLNLAPDIPRKLVEEEVETPKPIKGGLTLKLNDAFLREAKKETDRGYTAPLDDTSKREADEGDVRVDTSLHYKANRVSVAAVRKHVERMLAMMELAGGHVDVDVTFMSANETRGQQ